MDCPPTLDPADAALLEMVRALGPQKAQRLLTPLLPPARIRRLAYLVRVECARALLRERVGRPMIVERLAAGGCSRETAYRAIRDALELETVSRTPGR